MLLKHKPRSSPLTRTNGFWKVISRSWTILKQLMFVSIKDRICIWRMLNPFSLFLSYPNRMYRRTSNMVGLSYPTSVISVLKVLAVRSTHQHTHTHTHCRIHTHTCVCAHSRRQMWIHTLLVFLYFFISAIYLSPFLVSSLFHLFHTNTFIIGVRPGRT